MFSKFASAAFICLLLSTGCVKKTTPPPGDDIARMRSYLASPGEAQSDTSGRFIAVGHRFVVEAPEADLAKAWQGVIDYCRTIRCEVLASTISQAPNAPPSGRLSLRVIPGDIAKLFDLLAKSVTILEHSTEGEDKTATVVDVEAKLTNLTEFRNRLRAMLARSPSRVTDLIEVERELSKVQAELDSIVATRKALANETEKVAVQITFQSKRTITRTGALTPIISALQDSGSVLSESLANLITFILSIIPWLVLIVPAIWLGTKLYRKTFRKQKTSS